MVELTKSISVFMFCSYVQIWNIGLCLPLRTAEYDSDAVSAVCISISGSLQVLQMNNLSIFGHLVLTNGEVCLVAAAGVVGPVSG